MRTPVIEVAAGIIRAPDGRVLMAQRTAGQISPGFWELPGGKIDPGESAVQAVARELQEEVGIRAVTLRPWLRYEHAFPLRRIRLHFYKVEHWEGVAHGREGQQIAWVDPVAPAVAPVLPSVDRALVALGLPNLYAVCRSSRMGGPGALLGHVATGVRAGVKMFQLRVPELSPDQKVALARRARSVVAPFGARVVLVGSALEARRAGLDALHSTAADLRRLQARPPVKLWMCSCHDEQDLNRAMELGSDAAVVSPVSNSAAHADRPALGWDGLKRLCAAARIPLYAQGGLDHSATHLAAHAGAIGIATSRWTTAFADTHGEATCRSHSCR